MAFHQFFSVHRVPRCIGKRNVASVGLIIFDKTPKDENFCLRRSVALSTLIRVMTRICVGSLLIALDYKSSALHTYPFHDTDKCGQCHTYPEAALFIIWGTYIYQKYKLKAHLSSWSCWEPYDFFLQKSGSKPFKHPKICHNQWLMFYTSLQPLGLSPWIKD